MLTLTTDQGSITDIIVEGEVTISTGPISMPMFAEAYGSTISDFNYSTLRDTDRDGDVDGYDLAVFSERYRTAGGSK